MSEQMNRLGQEMRRFGPKGADHPSVGKPCAMCEVPFEAGEFTTLAAIGPDPDDAEQVQRMLAGRPYNARAAEIHWTCASQLPLEAR